MTVQRNVLVFPNNRPFAPSGRRPAPAAAGPSAGPNNDQAALNYRAVNILVRWMLYGFIFSLPFEYPDRKIPVEIPTLTAAIFLLVTLLDIKNCYRKPPKVIWLFALYVAIYSMMTAFVEHPKPAVDQIIRFIQIFFLFWSGYNLMRYEHIANRALLALGAGCGVLGLMQVLRIMTVTVYDSWGYYSERTTVLGQNPNNLANNLALGLIALLGIAAARNKSLPWFRYLMLPFALVLAKAIVDTGSRGGFLSLAGGMLVLMVTGETFMMKLRNFLIVLLAMAFLGVVVSNSTMRSRLEDSATGNMTGREQIYPVAWEIFSEKPIFGWGPSDNTYELGERLPHRPEDETRDYHNLPLSVLTATGLVGAVPFLSCILFCVYMGWRARRSTQGLLPFAIAVTIVLINTGGDWSASKLDWLLLAYCVASASTVIKNRKKPQRSIARPASRRFAPAANRPNPRVARGFVAPQTKV